MESCLDMQNVRIPFLIGVAWQDFSFNKYKHGNYLISVLLPYTFLYNESIIAWPKGALVCLYMCMHML